MAKTGRKPNARSSTPEHAVVGAKIRAFRCAAGISQAQLGEALDPPVSFQQVQKYEKGVNRVDHVKLMQICKAVGCTITDIVSDLKGEGQTSAQSAELLSMMGDHATFRLMKSFRLLPRDMQYKFIGLIESVAQDQAA